MGISVGGAHSRTGNPRGPAWTTGGRSGPWYRGSRRISAEGRASVRGEHMEGEMDMGTGEDHMLRIEFRNSGRRCRQNVRRHISPARR